MPGETTLNRTLTPHSRFRDRASIAPFRDVNSCAVRKARGALILRPRQMGDCDVHVQEEARNAVRRRCAAGPFQSDPDRREALCAGPSAQGSVSGGPRDGDFRPRLLLGRRAHVLAARRWHLHDGRRLCRRAHAEPDLRGSLFGPAPGTTRSCWWSTIRPRSPTSGC